jgi:hypothetical protein
MSLRCNYNSKFNTAHASQIVHLNLHMNPPNSHFSQTCNKCLQPVPCFLHFCCMPGPCNKIQQLRNFISVLWGTITGNFVFCSLKIRMRFRKGTSMDVFVLSSFTSLAGEFSKSCMKLAILKLCCGILVSQKYQMLKYN